MDVIITGCGRGIGFELVQLFAQSGNNRILAISRNINPIVKLCENLHHLTNGIIPLAMDFSDKNFTLALLEAVKNHQFQCNILINNAGAMVNKPVEALTEMDFDYVFNVNMKSPFLIVQSMMPYFAADAHIVNIGSMGGFQGSSKFLGLSLYSASKAALAVFTECLAEELKNSGIKTNCLALGATQTEMLTEAFPGYTAPQSAESMAQFIHHFAINGHHYFNGKVLPVSTSTP